MTETSADLRNAFRKHVLRHYLLHKAPLTVDD